MNHAPRGVTALLITVLGLGMVFLTACHGSSRSHVAADSAKPAVKLGPDEPSKALPPDFDKSLVNYPGASVEHVRRPKGAMREILLSSDAPFDQLIEYYKAALNKGGFEITSSLRIAARHTWSCDFHKSGRQASVMLYPSDKDKSDFTIDLIYEMPSRKNQEPTLPEETFDVVGPGEVAQQTTDRGEKRN